MKYTIAIPAYKSDFLKECIESILNQTFQDFELIIIDDVSITPFEKLYPNSMTHVFHITETKRIPVQSMW